jgi:ribosomal protein L24
MSTLHTKTKLRTGDEVVVIAGRDVGKRGTIQKILKNNRAVVTGVNIVKKHTKPKQKQQQPTTKLTRHRSKNSSTNWCC